MALFYIYSTWSYNFYKSLSLESCEMLLEISFKPFIFLLMSVLAVSVTYLRDLTEILGDWVTELIPSLLNIFISSTLGLCLKSEFIYVFVFGKSGISEGIGLPP